MISIDSPQAKKRLEALRLVFSTDFWDKIADETDDERTKEIYEKTLAFLKENFSEEKNADVLYALFNLVWNLVAVKFC